MSVRAALPLILLYLLGLTAVPVAAQPTNAQPRLAGPGWECMSGFQRQKNECVKKEVPVNALPRISYGGWNCDRGFERVGNECAHMKVPTNAELRMNGRNWRCMDNYAETDGRCYSAFTTPSDKDCVRGSRVINGKCRRFPIPEMGIYTAAGNDWMCQLGWVRIGESCRPMTDAERAVYQQEINLFDGTQFTLWSIKAACEIVPSEDAFRQLVCHEENLAAVENGCFISEQNNDGISRMHCPASALQPVTRLCTVSANEAELFHIDCRPEGTRQG